jgi:hypothetical protein
MSALVAILFALLPACPTEDSGYCGWDAQHQGNHIGRSFVQVGSSTLFLHSK